jgi:hypothetical protein
MAVTAPSSRSQRRGVSGVAISVAEVLAGASRVSFEGLLVTIAAEASS